MSVRHLCALHEALQVLWWRAVMLLPVLLQCGVLMSVGA